MTKTQETTATDTSLDPQPEAQQPRRSSLELRAREERLQAERTAQRSERLGVLEHGLGVGTTVAVGLPSAEGARPRATSDRAPRSFARASAAQARILVVDDEPSILRALKRLLHGFDVTACDSGRAAVELYRKRPFDLVFCDLMMPELDGQAVYEALHALGAEHARRIVFVTGGAFTDEAAKFLAEQPNTCIHKPFCSTEIQAVAHSRLGPLKELIS